MKKTIALFAAVLMLLCAVPFAAIGEMNLAAAKTAGDFPDAVFDPLGDAASVEYSHNTNFTGESGTEFVSDGENGIKSASGGMRSSVVTITITFGEAVSNARLSFDYKVSSEARYDYLSVNGSTEKTLSGEIDWTNYSQTVTAGSVVTLAYVKDSSGDRGSDCVWFKNFALQSLGTVTFENVDPLAVLTVRNAEGTTGRRDPRSADGQWHRDGDWLIHGHTRLVLLFVQFQRAALQEVRVQVPCRNHIHDKAD